MPDTEIEFLEAAAKRECNSSGCRVNLRKVCEILLKEPQSGKLGRITLETPEMLEVEKEEMALEAAKKAEAKAKRKQNSKQAR